MSSDTQRNEDPSEISYLAFDTSDTHAAYSINEMQKQVFEHQLARYKTSLKHHNATYWIGVIVLIGLLVCSLVPLLAVFVVIVYELIFKGESATIIAISPFISSGGAMIVLALYSVPVLLLISMLKQNSLSTQAKDTESGDIFGMLNTLRQ